MIGPAEGGQRPDAAANANPLAPAIQTTASAAAAIMTTYAESLAKHPVLIRNTLMVRAFAVAVWLLNH